MILLLAATGGLAACASSREYFRPTDNSVAEGEEGEPATAYEIRDQSGKLGEVNVWSGDAHKAKIQGEKRTVVEIGFRVKNLGKTPLMLTRGDLRMENVQIGKERLPSATLVSLESKDGLGETIPPSSLRDFTALFAVPAGVKPDDLDGFALRWAVSDGQRRFLQITPFTEDKEREMYVSGAYGAPYDPFFYDPFFYDPFFVSRPVIYPHRAYVYRGGYGRYY